MSRTYLTATLVILGLTALPAQAQNTSIATQTNATKADMSNVVRARFVKPGDVSPEEYQRLLAEADKIRAFQARQGQYQVQSQYPQQYVPISGQHYYGQTVQNQLQQPQPLTYPAQTGAQIVNQGSRQNSGQIQGPFYQQAQTPTNPVAVKPQVQTYTYGQTPQNYQLAPRPQNYGPVQPQTVQPRTVPTTFASPRIAHPVVKGDTLYNISKRYNVPLSTIRQANGLTTNTISIGQQIIIPSVQKVIATPASTVTLPVQTYSQPQYVTRPQMQPQVQPQYMPQTYQGQPYSATAPGYTEPSNYRPVSYQGTYPGTLRYQPASQVRVSSTGSKPTFIRSVEPVPPSGVYAVLPKDTLYSISKIACVKADDIAKMNGITDVSTLQPGQRLSMPAGHCLR